MNGGHDESAEASGPAGPGPGHQHLEHRFCPQCAAELVPGRGPGGQPGCPACGFVRFDNPKVATGVVVEHEGRVLLVRRNHEPMMGRWTFPSGFVDAGEVVGALRATAVGVRFGEHHLADLEVDMTGTGPVAAMEFLAERASGSLIEMPLTSVMLATIRGHRATLRIDPLAFNYRDMPLRATLDVEYHGDREAEEPVAPDFGELTRSTSAELELSFHKDLVDAFGIDVVANLLPAMARLELVRESGDQYHVHATYSDGEVLFDGKPVDVALLAALMAGI